MYKPKIINTIIDIIEKEKLSFKVEKINTQNIVWKIKYLIIWEKLPIWPAFLRMNTINVVKNINNIIAFTVRASINP